MQIILRHYQYEAIQKTIQLLSEGKNKLIIEMASGTGATQTLVSLVLTLLEQGKISNALFLSHRRAIADNILNTFQMQTTLLLGDRINMFDTSQIVVTTYNDFTANFASQTAHIDIIIFFDIQSLKADRFKNLLNNPYTYYIGYTDHKIQNTQNWFRDGIYAYQYSFVEAINDGYINPKTEHEFIHCFFAPLLNSIGYKNIQFDRPYKLSQNKQVRPDIVASLNDKSVIFEIKTYSSRHSSSNILNNAVNQLLGYKSAIGDNYQYILVLSQEISVEEKEYIAKQTGVVIWDIANLLYLCKGNATQNRFLADYIYYPINNIVPQPPIEPSNKDHSKENLNTQNAEDDLNSFEELIVRLEKCSPGKEDGLSKEYEEICTDIINYLFHPEFTQASAQHKTDDELFRMDFLCGIKGSSSFWKLLINHYNTRFVVFEYKNYSSYIKQNLIYITEKYLFNAALRNVAIIISRNGFDDNAHKAAMGCLKEHNKLILDLSDDDLKTMLRIKADGEDPSDYLLRKLEDFLMSISK